MCVTTATYRAEEATDKDVLVRLAVSWDLGYIWRHSMWDLWSTTWHWDSFFSDYFVFPCHSHSSIHRRRYTILATNDVVKQYTYETVSPPVSLTTACPQNNVTPTAAILPTPCTSTQCCNNHKVCRSRVTAACLLYFPSWSVAPLLPLLDSNSIHTLTTLPTFHQLF